MEPVLRYSAGDSEVLAERSEEVWGEEVYDF